MKQKFEVLMSCMFLDNIEDFLSSKNLESDILIINQCNEIGSREIYFSNNQGEKFLARVISTKDRGLSKSRNLAIANARGDILLISDQDVVFQENYSQNIIKTFESMPEADIILFDVSPNGNQHAQNDLKRIGYIGAMRAKSIETTFKREKILNSGVRFDETMGAGTGNGSGEENKFLFDCLKNNLRIFRSTIFIAEEHPTGSSWFSGYTKDYFINRGYSSRKILGYVLGTLYAIEWSLAKYQLYRNQSSFINCLYHQLVGIFRKY